MWTEELPNDVTIFLPNMSTSVTWHLPCVALFRSVLHAATYPTGRVSKVERHACSILLTCSYCMFCYFSFIYKLLLRLQSLIFRFRLYKVCLFWIFPTLLHCRSRVVTRCFILKIDQMAYAVPLSDFLSGWICSVLDCTFIAAARSNLGVRKSPNSKVAPKLLGAAGPLTAACFTGPAALCCNCLWV